MSSRPRSRVNEFEGRLGAARREVWRTLVRTDDELATLESHAAGALVEDAAVTSAAGLLAQLDTRQRHQLDEIDAAQARLAAGTFGACERCRAAIPLRRLRALPTARVCIACERDAERPGVR